jgi:hypothetical protein
MLEGYYVTYDIFIGFPKMYRRLREGIKSSNLTKENEVAFSNIIKQAIRFPDTAQSMLANTEFMAFVVKYNEKIMDQANVPPFFLTAAKLLFKQTPFGSVFDALYSEAKKAQKK